MKSLNDLKDVLAVAFNKNLIENFYTHSHFIDIDFLDRTETEMMKAHQLKNYIQANYEHVRDVEYMPIINRIRVYIC